MIGIGGQPRIDHAAGILEINPRALQRAQIGNAAGQHKGQLLHFRSAGVMDHPTVRSRERPLKSDFGQAFDGAGDRRHDLGPAIGTGSPDRACAKRIETEPDIAGRGVKTFALHIFGDMYRGHARLRTEFKFDRYAGVDEDALESLLDRFRRRLQPKRICAVCARKNQRQPAGPVLQVMHGLRVGLRCVRMIDPLHDLPRPARRPPRDGCRAPRARIDRLDRQAIIGLADQLFERRAF